MPSAAPPPPAAGHQPVRVRVRPVLRGRLGQLMIGVTAFELGNAAATLLILRATDLFDPGRSQAAATQVALVLYVLYNVAAAAISVPPGRCGDPYSPIRVLAAGEVCFAAGHTVFAAGPHQPASWPPGSSWAGSGSAVVRPPSRPRSPPWPPPACAAPCSVCSPPCRRALTWPSASSPESCGPLCPRLPRSSF
jgi:hypothetical protein